jgi:acetate kinase
LDAKAALQGVIIASDFAGERAPAIRAEICARLAWLGVRLDATANAANAARISTPDSEIEVRIIATDEETTIALHTLAIVAMS